MGHNGLRWAVVIALLAGCGKTTVRRVPRGPAPAPTDAMLYTQGVWLSECQSDRPFSFTTKLSFNGAGTLNYTVTHYQDPGCNPDKAEEPEVYGGYYSIGGDVTSAPGSKELTLDDSFGPNYAVLPMNNIVKVDGNTLQLGYTRGANNGSTPETRPTQLYPLVYTKQAENP